MSQKFTSWLTPKRSMMATSGMTNMPTPSTNHPQFGGGVLISIIFLITIPLLIFLWTLTPKQWGEKSRTPVTIRYGTSLRQVGILLESRGLIRNRLGYELYVRLNYKSRMAKAGWYQLSPGMSVPRIVQELRRGTPEEFRLTIPEGLTVAEIADLLARQDLIKRERFMELSRDRDFIRSILGDFPTGGSVEGYLFPDTYQLMLPASEKEIMSIMLKRFKQVFTTHFPDLPDTKWREAVIMASVVEKEAKSPSERSVIAGVFYNRIRLGYPLQSCATVQYALGTHKKRLLYKDLQVESPYNTYLHRGLPPGPIANPGLASLQAAVFPDKSEYLYFVAKNDGTHVFSRTYRDHLNAQRQVGIKN